MRKIILLLLSAVVVAGSAKTKKWPAVETWPDGTVMDAWFKDTAKVDIASLGRQYVITDYGVKRDSAIVQTAAIQGVIDRAARDGGAARRLRRGRDAHRRKLLAVPDLRRPAVRRISNNKKG